MSTRRDRPLNRAGIVDAARDLISRRGLDEFTLRRLGDVFGVSAPALYAHFSDKDELLRAVAEREFENLIADYEQLDAQLGPGEPLERIRAQCRGYVALARRDPELFRVMFLFPPDLGDIASLPEGSELPLATQAFDTALGAVREAIDDGTLEADDPVLVGMTVWAGAHGVANIVLLGLEFPDDFVDALVNEVTERTLLGYGTRSTSAADRT